MATGFRPWVIIDGCWRSTPRSRPLATARASRWSPPRSRTSTRETARATGDIFQQVEKIQVDAVDGVGTA